MSGWRVMVCRAAPDAAATAKVLAEAGHFPVVAPVLDIVALPVEWERVGGVDALLVTSANAIRMIPPDQVTRWADHPLYAVGRQTAALARRHGFADIRVASGDVASLVPLLSLTCSPTARLLYLAGRVRKPDLETALRAGTCRLSVTEVYDTASAPPWDAAVRDALAEGHVDACLHYSRRSAALAMAFAAVAEAGTRFRDLAHMCISADAAAPLREAGAPHVEVADTPEEGDLLRLLDRHRTPLG